VIVSQWPRVEPKKLKVACFFSHVESGRIRKMTEDFPDFHPMPIWQGAMKLSTCFPQNEPPFLYKTLTEEKNVSDLI